MEDDQDSAASQRQQYQSYRSTNSINWRTKDDSPRGDAPPQGRFRRDQRENEYGQSSPRGGGYGRRENNDYQPREQREIPGKPETPRLYVGNLLYTAQPDDISAFFTGQGFNVVNVNMNIDPATGRNPSYCFVDFDSVEEATRAMEQLNGSEVMGRSVRINPGVARKDGQSGGQRRGYGGGEGRTWRERESAGNFDNASPRASNERWGAARTNSSQDQPYSRPPVAEHPKRLYIGGLPSTESQEGIEAKITAAFSEAQPPIEFDSIGNLRAPQVGDNHYLFVDLRDEADTERAISELANEERSLAEGRKVIVSRAKDNRDRGDGQRRGGREGGRGFGRGGWRGAQQVE